MALLVWYLTKITALFFTLLCRFLGARKAAVLVSTNLTSPSRTTNFADIYIAYSISLINITFEKRRKGSVALSRLTGYDPLTVKA